jgi:hypothetical protein
MNVADTIRVDGILVDVAAIRQLAHRCLPMNCAHRRSCCATYEVPVRNDRIGTIVGAVHEAARFAPQLLEDGEPVDLFDETEGGLCLNTDESGRCLFAFHNEQGAPLCSLHAFALEAGLPPARVKPAACALWPLALSEGDPPTLGVQPGALDFACNALRDNENGVTEPLDPEVADLICGVFGDGFLQRLVAALDAE